MKSGGFWFATVVLLAWICQLLLASTVSESCIKNEDGVCQEENVFDVFGRWIDEVSKEGVKFLKQNVFDQKDISKDRHAYGETKEEPASQDFFQQTGETVWRMLTEMVSSEEESDSSYNTRVQNVLEQARLFATAKQAKKNFQDILTIFLQGMDKASASLEKHFGHIEFKTSLPISLWYWIEREDETKNPSWKRRQHRYYQDVDVKTVQQLHDDLYLSHLAYVETVDEIQRGLQAYDHDLELIYAQVESYPSEPAHFIALKREPKDKFKMLWNSKKRYLDVVIVIQGTSSFGDVLSDVTMDATDYRGGKTHDGVASSGINLVMKHTDLMQHLLEVSGRKQIRLLLTGHSLGAGAAAIAAIEFNQHDNIEARAVGFGCPALLTKELSESTKNYITTVIADSDVVPRMSGPSVANVILDMMSYDWTDRAVQDTKQLLEAMDAQMFFDMPAQDEIVKYLEDHLDKHDRPFFDKVLKERQQSVLIPPGTCIHVYRDGIGYSGKYTPCTFFNTIDVTRTMLRDHNTAAGYHRALLELARDRFDDVHFDFRHDLLAIAI